MNVDLDKSLAILELNNNYNINNIQNLTQEELKKKYHTMALTYHPDKNTMISSNEKFQNIHNAYNFLKNYISIYSINNGNSDIISDKYNYDSSLNYLNLIDKFLNLLIKKYTTNNLDKNELNNFEENCVNYSSEIFSKLIAKLNIDELKDIYSYFSTINNSLVNKLKDYLKKRLESFNIYIINPTINNLLNSEVYKLTINNSLVYIPLWHNELNYENNIIKIEPLLDENFYIDENNNLNYYYNDTFENIIKLLLNKQPLIIDILKLNLQIPIEELNIKENQNYIFKNIGIPIVNNNNIFDNIKKADIIITINLL